MEIKAAPKLSFCQDTYSSVEAIVSGHPRHAKKVSVTGASRLRECKNTEFVWELSKPGFCEGGRK